MSDEFVSLFSIPVFLSGFCVLSGIERGGKKKREPFDSLSAISSVLYGSVDFLDPYPAQALLTKPPVWRLQKREMIGSL